MIVKNESSIIERCLKSVAPFISTWVIHDTGSTDSTREKIVEFFKELKMPGVLSEVTFKDFEFNRNAALKEAVKQKEIDYVLFIDADMELHVPDKTAFYKFLTAPSYRICQLSGSLSYFNTRLVGRAIFETAKYVGVTHEYICTGDVNNINIPTSLAVMNDSGDGGCKSDKFPRDERLLSGDLLVNPSNPRSRFYLAQTYNHQGKHTEAIQQYELYLKNPGFEEEAWYAQYMLCLMHKNKGDDAKSLLEGMKAFERRPRRGEPLLKMAEHCRFAGWNHMAWIYAKLGNTLLLPDDSLFVELPVYDFLFLFEMTITAYYVKELKLGLQISNNLLLTHSKRHGVSGWHLECIKKNISFYLEPLKDATHHQLVAPETGPGWNCFNPSIAFYQDHLHINLRSCNYVMSKDMIYSINTGYSSNTTPSYDNPIKTKNMRCTWTNDAQSSCIDFSIPDQNHEKFSALIQGYEDLRIFVYRGELWYTATTRGLMQSELNTMVAGTSDKLFLLQSPKAGRCEKNWIAFEHRGKLLIIYQFSPFTIFQLNPDTGAYCTYLEMDISDIDFSNFRGGSNPCRVKDGYYMVIHEVLPHYSGPRKYTHRILFMTDDLNITHVSKPFVLKNNELIEYVSGLAILNDTVYLTWGEMDAKAYLTTLSLSSFEQFCKEDGPIDELSLIVPVK